MQDEIKQIIEKNLPAQVGEILKKHLEQADKNEAELKSVKDQNQKLIDNAAVLNKRLSEYAELDSRNSKLEAREKEVSEQERNQKVFAAELKASEAEKRATEIAGFAGMVFKSPVFRTSYQNEVFSSYDNQGRYNQTGGIMQQKTTTEE